MTLPKKILLAEDDEDDRSFFQDFLQEREDIHLLPPVENGIDLIEALDAIEDETSLPDIIILDQNMPKQNGLQTLNDLKLNSRYGKIPVIVYSTYADERLMTDGTQLGASLVIAKPADKSGYDKMIDEIFEAIN